MLIPSYPGKLILTDSKGQHHFSTNEVIRLQAKDNYTVVYFRRGRPFLVSKVLKIYEDLLLPFGFLRTHRSHLVNWQFIKDVQQRSIVMQDNSMAKLTKRKRSRIVKQLNMLLLSG